MRQIALFLFAAMVGSAIAAERGGNAVAGQTIVLHSNEFPRNGEASMARLKGGELLCLFGAHRGSGDWDRAVIRQVRSDDGGRTWSAPATVLEDRDRSLFQPSLARLPNGELGLTHTVLRNGQDAHKVFRRSADDGRTWSEPLRISDESHAYTTGPHDRLYTLASGRLVALVHCNLAPKRDRQGGPLGAYVIHSDDLGRTWTRTPRGEVLHVADNPHKKPEWGFWEPSLVETAPGKLLLLARTAAGWLYESRSGDNGATWSKPARSPVANPLAPPVLTRIPGSATLVLLHNPRVEMAAGWHGGARTILAFRTSRDAGRSWTEPHPIAVAPNDDVWYDYPAALWVGDTLHVVYRTISTQRRGAGGFKVVDLHHQALDAKQLRKEANREQAP